MAPSALFFNGDRSLNFMELNEISKEPELGGFFINGRFVSAAASRETVDLISPSTGEVFARAPRASLAEAKAALSAARRAFDDGPWPQMSTVERADVLMKTSLLLETRIEDAARLQTDEMGAPITLTRMTATMAVELVREMCQEVASYAEVETRFGQREYEIRTEPYGVVATISPWNGPFLMTVLKGATALLAGCTVVDKPPIEAPLSSLVFAEALRDAGLPAGAFNIVAGDGAIGEALVASPLVDMVSFTGGAAVGRRVGELAGARLKRVVLELGGKSPGLVLPDGDVATAVAAVSSGVFFNSGQVCSSLTRLLVPRTLADEAIDRLAQLAQYLAIGDPHDTATQVGPLATERHRSKVEADIKKGLAEGARLVVGGRRPSKWPRGWYLEPTVLADVKNSDACRAD